MTPSALSNERLAEMMARLPHDLTYGPERGAGLEPSVTVLNTSEARALITELQSYRSGGWQPMLSNENLSFVFALLGADTPDEARNVWMRNPEARVAAHTEMQIARALNPSGSGER